MRRRGSGTAGDDDGHAVLVHRDRADLLAVLDSITRILGGVVRRDLERIRRLLVQRGGDLLGRLRRAAHAERQVLSAPELSVGSRNASSMAMRTAGTPTRTASSFAAGRSFFDASPPDGASVAFVDAD